MYDTEIKTVDTGTLVRTIHGDMDDDDIMKVSVDEADQ